MDANEMREMIEARYEDYTITFLDGYDGAISGVTTIDDKPVVLYSEQRIISILEREHEMTRDEAVDFFDFNVQSTASLSLGVLIIDDVL